MQFLKILLFLCLLFCLSEGYSQKNNWLKADVFFFDKSVKKGFVQYKETSYFAFIKFRDSVNAKTTIVNPDEVKKIIINEKPNISFVSINLKGTGHFTNDSYFAKYIVQNRLSLLKSRVFYKTCSCNSRGSYRYALFLFDGDSLYFVNTNRKKHIINIDEINSLLNNNSYHGLVFGKEDIFELEKILIEQ